MIGRGLSKKISKHENSNVHLEACLLLSTWKSNKTIDIALKSNVEQFKQIIKRLIDVTRTLAICNLPFRGHSESYSETLDIDRSKGVFINIVKLLARYDPVLNNHITNRLKRNHYLSNRSQNGFIDLLGMEILKSIKIDINSSPFFSIILDTTQDITRKDQMSIVIRYIKIDEVGLRVVESFLGFKQMMEQSAKDFEIEILQFLENNNISLDKCRGQGYDGAANMSGITCSAYN